MGAEAKFPAQRAVRVTIKLKNGTSYQEWLEGRKCSPQNPMSMCEIEDKFRDQATLVLPESRVEEIIKMTEA